MLCRMLPVLYAAGLLPSAAAPGRDFVLCWRPPDASWNTEAA